jgi:hypothetical protein
MKSAGALAAALLWLAPAGASGEVPVRFACEASALVALEGEIASAETLGRAQELAGAPLRLAREAAVAVATTPDAVAGAFSLAVRGAPEAAFGCSYTTLEIVAIVLGFILGIIPGIILLIILC